MNLSRRSPHLLIIGDVGGPATYHVGDEAMLEANLTRFRHLIADLSFTAVSRDPEWTSRQHGVLAIPPIGFPPMGQAQPAQRDALLAAVLEQAENAASGRPIPAGAPGSLTISTLLEADGLVVSGGGNLCSRWPEHVYQRVALIQMAHRLGKPVVVLGQTLGPHLAPRQRDLLSRTLPLARLVVARETASAGLALALGVEASRLACHLDDAFFLQPRPPDPASAGLVPQPPWIGVSFSPLPDSGGATGLLQHLARALETLAASTGAQLVFIPHVSAPADDPGADDRLFGLQLASRLKPPATMAVLPAQSAAVVRWLTGQASMVLGNRYHPLVFALSAGVPCLGLQVDEYTRTKLVGALEHADLGDWALPLKIVEQGSLADVALQLWNARQSIARSLAQASHRWRCADRLHWARICHSLDLQPRNNAELPEGPLPHPPASPFPPDARPPQPTTDQQRLRILEAEIQAREHRLLDIEQYALSLRAALDARDRPPPPLLTRSLRFLRRKLGQWLRRAQAS